MPLRLRLALWYGGLTAVVVLLVGMLGYAVHSRAYYEDLDQVLVSSAEHLLEEAPMGSVEQRIAALTAPIAPDVVTHLHGPDGEVVASGPNGELAPAVKPADVLTHPSGPPFAPIARIVPPTVHVDVGPGALGTTTDPTGARWRVYVRPVEGAPAGYLVVASPLGRVDSSLRQFRRATLLLSLGGMALTLVVAWLLAGRALRPVAQLTATAGTIARSRRFGERVPVPSGRDEMAQMAATFNAMLDSLQDAYRLQQRFVADASHELRAPLTAIQANLDLLEHQPDLLPADRQEAAAEASREAQRLARQVGDLLTLARADAGMPLHKERVELDRVLLESIADARHLARGQRVDLAALEPSLVNGDPDRLKQLILILLDNALKYTPAAGRVAVALHRDGATATLTVQDTGVGIAPDDLPHVFERFYRSDPARARDPGGTGLGLAIARWIAEEHGGTIRIESRPGRGTTVVVCLPTAT